MQPMAPIRRRCSRKQLDSTVGQGRPGAVRSHRVRRSPPRLAFALILLALSTALQGQSPTNDAIRLPDGFRAEVIYEVPAETQGSWVALAPTEEGLIAADQYGGLYNVQIPDGNAPVYVESLDLGVGHAQGLMVHDKTLWVMVNQEGKSGLYRCRASGDKSRWQKAELWLRLHGSGEHGPHAIALDADGRSLWIAAGNHTDLPRLTHSRVPQVWDEDLALPRIWDPQGHATGIMAPGGWICRVSLDQSECELMSIGFRNQYDIALNREHQLFTMDADMEWDAGTAWYRPTRLLHVTSGSEFGWRGGTGKWPAYFPDSLPPVVEMGPGSPTGMTFGTDTNFPPPFQEALFAADWSRGRIHAIHLTGHGASFRGRSTLFASSAALPVTDMVVRPQDGCLYFATGGRRLISRLYRIRYDSPPATDPAATHPAAAERVKSPRSDLPTEPHRQLLSLRRRLEALHRSDLTNPRKPPESIVSEAIPYLSHPDRHIRFAARVAIELQPTKVWMAHRPRSGDKDGRITMALAVARTADKQQLPKTALDLLSTVAWDSASREQRVGLLRAYTLASIRSGSPSVKKEIVKRFAMRFPCGDRVTDRELARALAHAKSKGAGNKVLACANRYPSTTDATLFLLACTNIPENVDLDAYFEVLVRTRSHGAGKSFGGYIDTMARRMIDGIPEKKRAPYQAIASKMQTASRLPTTAMHAPRVRNWSLDEVLALLDDTNRSSPNDLAMGRDAFVKSQCGACHQVNGEFHGVGPDLSTIGSRFRIADLATAIVKPSDEISDQYAQQVFALNNGRTVVGQIVDLHADQWFVATDMMNPGKLESIRPSDVEQMQRSGNSPMPSGLLDVLNAKEIRCLFAYLRSLRPDFPSESLNGLTIDSEPADRDATKSGGTP